MYTIQRHKAREYVLDALKSIDMQGTPKYRDISIVYQNDKPQISYIDNTNHGGTLQNNFVSNPLECLCWGVFKENECFLKYVMVNVFEIYGILYTSHSDFIEFPIIQESLKFVLRCSAMYHVPKFCVIRKGDPFYMATSNDYSIGDPATLLFLIDPLQAINKMDKQEHKYNYHIVKNLFEHIKCTITNQGEELLLKYLLIVQIVNKYMTFDIVHVIVDILVGLLLLPKVFI